MWLYCHRLKTVSECRVVIRSRWRTSRPMSLCRVISTPSRWFLQGVYPADGDDYGSLKEALEKLQLNDASLTFEPESSEALNFGFRCGFLGGLFHMEIIQERIEREYDLNVVFTAPSVEYKVDLVDGKSVIIDSPADLPDMGEVKEIFEPWMMLEIFTPTDYYGVVMELVKKRRGIFVSQEYPAANRVQLNYEIPLSEIIVDFLTC